MIYLLQCCQIFFGLLGADQMHTNAAETAAADARSQMPGQATPNGDQGVDFRTAVLEILL